MDNYILFIFIAIVVLTPIIPAFVFFKIIPTQKADINGTFAGLKFKLSGAFGGYFLIMFILIIVFAPRIEDTDKWEIWEIEGQIEFEGGDGSVSTLEFGIVPPLYDFCNNTFSLKVYKIPDMTGELKLPNIAVMHENFRSRSIVFTDEDNIDAKAQKRTLNNKIILIKEPQQ